MLSEGCLYRLPLQAHSLHGLGDTQCCGLMACSDNLTGDRDTKATILQQDHSAPGGMWPCLETFLVVAQPV